MRFLEQQGVTRVVPARELTLEELAAMHRESSIEIEAFIHGALCYSISGQCLMSSMIGGRSGNRGKCAQPCRLPYQVRKQQGRFKGKETCPLSLKDICTLDILPEILDAGVMSLKIEGRMKQPEYTAAVTGIYRKYLDILKENRDSYKVDDCDRKYLLDVFNRGGSCSGYYKQQNGPSMVAFSNHKKTGDISVSLTRKKEKISGTLMLYPESPAVLQVSLKDTEAVVSAGEVQYAREHPMEETRIRQQMEKLGNTEFVWDSLDIQSDGNIFVPVKVLNELRRTALAQLEQAFLEKYKRMLPEKSICPDEMQKSVKESAENIPPIYASCEKPEQAEVLFNSPEISGLYLPFDIMEICMEQGLQKEKELYLSLPVITRGKMPQEFREKALTWLSMGMKGFLVRNLESMECCEKRDFRNTVWQTHLCIPGMTKPAPSGKTRGF